MVWRFQNDVYMKYVEKENVVATSYCVSVFGVSLWFSKDSSGGFVKYIRFGIVGTNYYCNSKFKDIFSVDLKRILTSSER